MRRPILTPDRRLRVFVSSTLRELALERAEAREAIASLRLAPILFEQGARPHAPRDLYAAYVGQSDIFVGIYWQSYGWVAPGTAISGIEDEFELGQGERCRSRGASRLDAASAARARPAPPPGSRRRARPRARRDGRPRKSLTRRAMAIPRSPKTARCTAATLDQSWSRLEPRSATARAYTAARDLPDQAHRGASSWNRAPAQLEPRRRCGVVALDRLTRSGYVPAAIADASG